MNDENATDKLSKTINDCIIAALKLDPVSFFELIEKLRCDRELFLEAVKKNGLALRYANPFLREDKELVLEAVRENGLALKYADWIWQNDPDVVLEAIRENPKAYQFASYKIKNDPFHPVSIMASMCRKL